MTTLTNEEVVSELYWTQKAIKEVLGITPKCWRPPFGDVDDRVRAIAWLMGMRTIIWDRDTNDWGLVSAGGIICIGISMLTTKNRPVKASMPLK